MNKKIQEFLDVAAGLRNAYYQRHRELCAIQKYIEKMETENWKPQKINVGTVQDEFVEIDNKMMFVLEEYKKEQIKEIEKKVSNNLLKLLAEPN